MSGQFGAVLRYIRKVAAFGQGADSSDAELLERFIIQRDEAAFEALMQRHGPMVLGVCRRVLDSPHDVEDAFQATFFVLVRKAGSIGNRELLANWLYGVAYRTALNARRGLRKERSLEREVFDMPAANPNPELGWHDLRPVLDEEVNRLPARFRIPFVLCYLEGKTYEEAGRQLGCPKGTVATRLAKAREMLRNRLSRRGHTFPSMLFAGVLSQNLVPSAVPSSLMVSTLKGAVLAAAGPIAITGVISAKAAALTEGVLENMFLTKMKITVLVLSLGLFGTGAGLLTYQALAAKRTGNPGAVDQAVPDQKVQEKKQASVDRYGDPLPQGALARLGTLRLRHGHTITSVCFSADGKTLASGSWDHTVRLWDSTSGKELNKFTFHQEGVSSVTISPDGETLASGAMDKTLRFWDVIGGREIFCSPKLENTVLSARFSPDGKTVASLSGNVIRLWDLGTKQEIRRWQKNRHPIFQQRI